MTFLNYLFYTPYSPYINRTGKWSDFQKHLQNSAKTLKSSKKYHKNFEFHEKMSFSLKKRKVSIQKVRFWVGNLNDEWKKVELEYILSGVYTNFHVKIPNYALKWRWPFVLNSWTWLTFEGASKVLGCKQS